MMEQRMARWWGAAVLVTVGFAVYANSLSGPFIFDDIHSIVESPNVRSLSPLSEAISAPQGSGASGRPLVALSLALNYAFGGLEVFGYHLFNVGAHVLTALALFGFALRALLRTRFESRATAVAFAIALLWVVHPLNSDALNHVITRNEVLPALFILTCLWAVERGADSPGKSRPWFVLAVCASCAAMMSKEIAVSLPLLALAYDRTFIAGTFKRAWKARRGLYVGLMASWGALMLSIQSGDRGVAVGFDQHMSSLDYLRTQAEGLVHYLRLSLWPSGLALDYSGWEPVRSWGPALLPGALILALLVAGLVAFVRGNKAGWVALAIFAILAPSSSVIPITGEWLAEHRMYLPLAGLVALIVVGSVQLLGKLGARRAGQVSLGLVVLVSLALGKTTFERNRDYESEVSIWEDCLDKYPNNARAHDHLAALWLEQLDFERALVHAEQAIQLDPTLFTVDYNLATILQQQGKHERALEHFERAKAFLAGDARFHANYGVALAQVGRRDEAIAQLRRAIELAPDYASAHRNLGALLLDAGDSVGAVVLWRRSIELQPDVATIMGTIQLLASDPNPHARSGAEALALAKALIKSGPPDPRWFDLLGMSHAELGQFDAALKATRKALQGAEQLRQQKLIPELQARIALYENDQPYRGARH